MEKANADKALYETNEAAKYKEEAKAEAMERLNEVRTEIKEVEAQLEQAKRNAKFEDKYKDNPYWQIAKKRYIETGDPSSIENFRARQEALETSEKDRKLRREVELENKNKQFIYDEAEAIKEIRLREEDKAKAIRAGDKELEEQAEVYLEFAKKKYKNLTGKDWDEVSKEYKKKSSEPSEETPVGNEGQDNEPWWKSNPLAGESGAKNAKEFGVYLMKFSDTNDKNGQNRIADEATKNSVISWIDANKDKWSELGLDQTKVNSIKSHWSKEKLDNERAKKAARIKKLKEAWNAELDKETPDEKVKKKILDELELLGAPKPKDLSSKYVI